jgi:hypothetical protein
MDRRHGRQSQRGPRRDARPPPRRFERGAARGGELAGACATDRSAIYLEQRWSIRPAGRSFFKSATRTRCAGGWGLPAGRSLLLLTMSFDVLHCSLELPVPYV